MRGSRRGSAGRFRSDAMSGKDRERLKRRQRREERRRQKRAQARPRAVPRVEADLRRHASGACIEACGSLLAGEGRIEGELAAELKEAGSFLGGVWLRLVFDLDAFLHDGHPWELRTDELRELRGPFTHFGAGAVYDRLLALCSSNDPELLKPAGGPQPLEAPSGASLDEAGRLAFAFWQLRLSLDAPGLSIAAALKCIGARVAAETRSRGTARALTGLLETAVGSLRPTGRGRKPAVPKQLQFARSAEAFLRARGHSEAEWWECSRMLLVEVLRRQVLVHGSSWLAEFPQLIEALYGAPLAAILGGSTERRQRLAAIHCNKHCEEWLGFLQQHLPREMLPFEERVRYEIARLKLLLTRAIQASPEVSSGERRELFEAFEGLFGLLGRGVPPEARHLPPVLEPILVDFYVEAARRLDAFKLSLNLSQALLQRHREDHRLGCLLVTGALLSHDGSRVARLDGAALRGHFDPGLFVHCAALWPGAAAGETARRLLYAPLDREQKKQCLIGLARRSLRSARSEAACRGGLEALAPYLDADGFLYEALRHGAALERELVFLGTLIAAWRDVPLPTLPYAGFAQFLGHAAELCERLPSAVGLVAEFLQRHPERWFTAPDGLERLRALAEVLPPEAMRRLAPLFRRLLGRLTQLSPEGHAERERMLRQIGERPARGPRRRRHRPLNGQMGLFDDQHA